jgi:cardiolipin synthase
VRVAVGQSGIGQPGIGQPGVGQPGVRRRGFLSLAAAAGLAGCASVPDIDAALHDGTLRRRILGGPSPLSSRQAAQVIGGIPEPLRGDALQQQYALQAALSEAPLVFGNTAVLLRNGAEALPALFQAMASARDHINLEYFIVADVHWGGTTLSEVLLGALARGVRVNIIYDAYGSRDTPAAFFATLRQARAKVVTFNPLSPFAARTGWAPNDRDHRKIAVVDGRVGFTGGINLDRTYENPPAAGMPADGDTQHAFWRDVMVRIEGPAVAELQKLFFGTWTAQKGPTVVPGDYFPRLPRTGVQTIRIIGSAPGDARPLYYVSVMTAIRAAQHSVMLSSGYFVPPHQEREDLAAVARAGIDLRIVTPAHSDVDAAVYAARAAYGDLLEAGAHIYEVQDAVLHAKLVVVDGVWSVVGSSNLDRRSVVFNNEVDAIILGRETGAQVEAILREDIAASREISLQRWSQRSLQERWRELEARVWQYWM